MQNNSIIDLYDRWLKAKLDKRDAEEREGLLRAQLAAKIPVDQARKGILHVKRQRKNVAWKAISDSIIRGLVPKTKWKAADTIISDNTSISHWDDFKPAG